MWKTLALRSSGWLLDWRCCFQFCSEYRVQKNEVSVNASADGGSTIRRSGAPGIAEIGSIMSATGVAHRRSGGFYVDLPFFHSGAVTTVRVTAPKQRQIERARRHRQSFSLLRGPRRGTPRAIALRFGNWRRATYDGHARCSPHSRTLPRRESGWLIRHTITPFELPALNCFATLARIGQYFAWTLLWTVTVINLSAILIANVFHWNMF